VDFKETDFQYKSSTLKPQELDDDEIEANNHPNSTPSQVDCGFEAVEQPAAIINVEAKASVDSAASQSTSENDTLLKELGLYDVDLLSNPQTISNQKDSIAAQNDGYDFDLFLNQATAATTSLERDLMSSNAEEMDLLLQ